MKSKEHKQWCFDLGYNGYKNGLKAPAECEEWRKSCEGLKIGDYSGANDWMRGWYKAHDEVMRERFPELYRG